MSQTQPDSATKLKNSRTDRATAKAELQAVRKKSKRIEKTLETLEAEKRQIEEFMGKSAAQWTVFGFHRGCVPKANASSPKTPQRKPVEVGSNNREERRHARQTGGIPAAAR